MIAKDDDNITKVSDIASSNSLTSDKYDQTQKEIFNQTKIYFIRLNQAEDIDEKIELLIGLYEFLGNATTIREVAFAPYCFDVIINLYRIPEIFEDEETGIIVSHLLNMMIHVQPERYVPIFISCGGLEVIKEFFTAGVEVEIFVPDVLFTSFEACQFFVENGLVEQLYEIIESRPLLIHNFVSCVAALAHYNAFEDQILPFCDMILSIALEDGVTVQLFQSCFSALSSMATYSEKLATVIAKDPRVRALIQTGLAKVEALSKEPNGKQDRLFIDCFIDFIGGLLAHPGIFSDQVIIEFTQILCNFYSSDDIFFVKKALIALVKGCNQGPLYVQILIDKDVLTLASVYFNSDTVSFKDKCFHVRLIFGMFCHSSSEQLSHFIDEPVDLIKILIETSQAMTKVFPQLIISTIDHLFDICSEIANEEIIETMLNSDEINQLIEDLCDSTDDDVKYKAMALKDKMDTIYQE